MKKFMVVLLVLSLTLSMVACGNKETSQDNDNQQNSNGNVDSSGDKEKDKIIEIDFWTMSLSPTFDDYINGMIEAFEAEHSSIKVKWTDVPWGNMETKILTAVAGGSAPDVVNLNPQFAAKLATAGSLINPEAYMSEQEKDAYFKFIYESNAYQGNIFALPWYITNSITIYNTDLYEQAGADVFTSYDDLIQVARKIKEETGKYAYFPSFDGTHLLETIASKGIPLVKDGKAAFNTDDMKEMIELYTTLYKEKLIPTEILTGGHQKAREMYMSGDVATLISGPTMLGPIKNDAPAIYDITDVEEAPTSAVGHHNAAIMNIAIPEQKDDTKYEAAAKFALFVTNAENQLAFCKVAGTILPATKASLEDSYFKNDDQTIEGKAKMIAASQLENSKALIPPMEKLSDLNDIMVDEVQKAMIGNQSSDDAINNALEGWNKVLEKVEHPIDF
ncbi:sugar ABC transporter substrate-binding protein [Vallitalea pronyensis]|uniref:Sugar ABC transporter substrate-binding protein n=1 Tax=Vallitalea pronyensis TaxID=1348613 RepID=A0A8J8MJS8_9FIRM|nr:sugar ABC transporter substrate-binding protein [Vallitalea pronyensis]QUI22959.1 sugar ABC transporter substrate-binding protein [Vallitalea pronyensis]